MMSDLQVLRGVAAAVGDQNWSRGKIIFEAADEIERLCGERDNLIEQAALRTPSAVERDMQEIMRINNELKATIADLKAALLRYGHHDCGCRKTDTFPVEPCSCGWDAALARAKQKEVACR